MACMKGTISACCMSQADGGVWTPIRRDELIVMSVLDASINLSAGNRTKAGVERQIRRSLATFNSCLI